jgi:uncharacterized SAM-binding protein YcdF (DUF218 family)
VAFFVASKLFGALITGGNFIIVLLVIGVTLSLTRYRRLGRSITLTTVATSLIILVFPIGSWATAPLENRFARPVLPNQVDGILVLGGGENPELFQRRGTAAVIYSEGRLVEAIALSRRFPQARIVFSGFEAEVARAAFEQLGADINRISFEGRARNTWENLLFSKDLIHPRPDETWLLVTHAISIPRAVGVARQVGWHVLPWPVDYQTGVIGSSFSPDFAGHLGSLEVAAHEWIGLFVYRLNGQSATWYPSPEDADASPIKPEP